MFSDCLGACSRMGTFCFRTKFKTLIYMKTIGWIATILFVIFCLYICSAVDTSIDEDITYMVVYEVECDASCDISYVNETGGMSVADGMRKWSEVMFVKGGT